MFYFCTSPPNPQRLKTDASTAAPNWSHSICRSTDTEMKIVTYNVNGLRQRVNQFGSLLKLLNSFDADIICFQETKLRRQEITSDLAIANGYESFFSCTRTSDRGRTGYSGVATFCRVKSAFSSTEVALPVAAEEGFTGLVDGSKNGKGEIAQVLEEFDRDELVKVDSEGRCVITDHGHFVLFNIYGPRADGDDTERVQFKLKFYKMLQERWESLLHQGRRVFVVGDLNIAPTAMDRCEAGPDFEKNEFRSWLRSMLVGSGGAFSDVFRSKHPDRREAYTCWSSSTGAEQFNYGSRIDHILCAGACLHQEHDSQGHNFVTCHVKDCDILTEYKRWKPGITPSTHRWKGGLNIKLEGSDHAPVFMSLMEIPDIVQHGTPSLSSRYLPMIRGLQQTIVSVLMKSQAAIQVQSQRVCSSFSDGNVSSSSCGESKSSSLDNCGVSGLSVSDSCPLFGDSDGQILETDEEPKDFTKDARPNTNCLFQNENIDSSPPERVKKKARKGHQLSLRSFFQKSSNPSNGAGPSNADDNSLPQAEIQDSSPHSNKTPVVIDKSSNPEHYEVNPSTVTGDKCEVSGCSLEEKKSCALLEWQRIQRLMRNSLPLCKGHKEPCVSRIVKKPGPTFGRRFYVCARAEGPASNPEANCGYFKWASLKSQQE